MDVRPFAAARAIGKPGLEPWTTTRTPDVEPFLLEHGFAQVPRYLVTEPDVAAAPDPGEPAVPLVTVAELPELGPASTSSRASRIPTSRAARAP